MLLGDDDRVVRQENGIRYVYRLTRSMFSMGNVEERRRMGEVDAGGETVLDLYAGIGYYTLPLLVHAGAAAVIACECSDDAIEGLEAGLRLNGVAERCTVLRGDNRDHADVLAGSVDRVVLGLLPNAWNSVPVGLAALRTAGGLLHLHGTAPPDADGRAEWLGDAIRRCEMAEAALAETDDRLERTIVAMTPAGEMSPVIRVKSHSPRWHHVVVDLCVGDC